VIESFTNAVPAVRELLVPGRLKALQKNVRSLHNRAVFEIPECLAQLLGERSAQRNALPVELKAGS
jgi:hypothetical protein